MAIFKYIFSFILILSSFSDCISQEENNYAPEEEKAPLSLKGLKLGLNVGRFTDFQFKPERFSYEASLDFNISDKYFAVFEMGRSEINLEKENYTYLSEGSFYKLGMDFNLLKKHPTDYLGIGLRLGRADFNQSATNILFEDIHWPVSGLSFDSKSHTTYWLEISFGLKGELFKNVYFGWAALARVAVSGRKDSHLQPYDIPGFGKGANTVNLGANYYIYYQFPFNKK